MTIGTLAIFTTALGALSLLASLTRTATNRFFHVLKYLVPLKVQLFKGKKPLLDFILILTYKGRPT
jgi:hypothetical protein